MKILLLGRETSITDTIRDMLISVEKWSVTSSFSIEDIAAEFTDDSLFDLIVANLADFPPPPTTIINKITDHFPSSYLLVLYVYSKKLLIQPLLDAGATGYLQNGVPEDKLLNAARTVAKGQQFIGIESTH